MALAPRPLSSCAAPAPPCRTGRTWTPGALGVGLLALAVVPVHPAAAGERGAGAAVRATAPGATADDNLLPPHLATFEARAVGGALHGADVSWDSTRARSGVRSLKTTATSSGRVAAYLGDTGDLGRAGAAAVSAWVFVDSADRAPRTVGLSVDWKVARGGPYVGSAATEPLAVAAGRWTQLSDTVVVPPGADLGTVFVSAAGTAAGDAVHWDDVAVRTSPPSSSPAQAPSGDPSPSASPPPPPTVVEDGGGSAVTPAPADVDPVAPAAPAVATEDGAPPPAGRDSRVTGGAFPMGVWLADVSSQRDVDRDRAAGINLYVGLTASSTLPLAAANRMPVLAQDEWWSRAAAPGSEAFAGWLLGDEVDMTDGPDRGAEVMRSRRSSRPDQHRLTYANYGKGVTFWHTDAQAARFLADLDVVSADNYWFTDPWICSQWEGGALLQRKERALTADECRLAANYGATVRRVRSLVAPGADTEVWGFVELGHPFDEDEAPTVRPDEVTAAVWSSIINGARGIVYFNHSFGGGCRTQNVLRDGCYADVLAEVASTNAEVQALAPVLASPTLEGLVRTTSQVEVAAKRSGGHLYLLTGSTTHRSQQAELRLPCTGRVTATVLYEDRTVPVVDGVLTDGFADGTTNHVYRIPAGSCGG